MSRFLSFKLWFALSTLALLAACAQPVKHADYTAFKNSLPHSILVLPPENETTDVQATNSMLSQMTMPLAESGYYVVPVAVMDETFRQNGLTVAAEIQATSAADLGRFRRRCGAVFEDHTIRYLVPRARQYDYCHSVGETGGSEDR